MAIAGAFGAAAQGPSTTSGPIVVDTVARSLGQTSAMAFIAADTALVATYAGELIRLELQTGRLTRLVGVPRGLVEREASLKDIELHPDFAANRLLYLSLVVGTRRDNALAVVRGRLLGDALVDTVTILVTAARDSSVDHYGGQLAFHEGALFVSNGDRANRARVADLGYHHGKILRVDSDGQPLPDNPFVGRPGARPEIWSLGHRNVQGLASDGTRGILWASEHGPRHGDELNRIERGADYGWPRISWGWEYTGGAIGRGLPTDSATGTPAWIWSPAVAPSGLLVYSGRAFGNWRGNLLGGGLQPAGGQHLSRLVWDGVRVVQVERVLPGFFGRIRFVAEDPRGSVYLGNDTGEVVRLRPR